MADAESNCYAFGEFRLDARRRSLSRGGVKVAVSARNFDLLLFMVENGGRILEHDELLDKVWAGTFVEQATLKKGVSALRQILAEEPEVEFIQTIPRRGYSFVWPVTQVPAENEVVLVRETEREIIVEEYEESDYVPDKFDATPGQQLVLPAAGRSTKWRNRAIVAVAGVAVLGVIVVGLKFYLSRNSPPPFAADDIRITRITNNGRVISGAAISPDGNYILYPTVEKDGVVLWMRQVLADSATKVTQPAPGSFWAFGFAPDNSYVYYIFNNPADPQASGLFKIPFLGGEPQRLVQDVSSFSLSPDGKRIAVVRLSQETRISTLNTNGTDERQVTTYSNDIRLWNMIWNPDSSALLLTIRKTAGETSSYQVTEISLADGRVTELLPAQERVVYGATWLVDRSGLLLIVREPNADIRQIWFYTPSGQTWRRITNDNNSYKLVSLTRDGKSILSTQESRLAEIWMSDGTLFGPDGKGKVAPAEGFKKISREVSGFDQLGWLADGRLFYAKTEDRQESIYTINADGANARPVTNGDDGIWLLRSMTGNGNAIFFLSSRSGAKQIWRIDADGRNQVKLTNSNLPVAAAQILRDNSTIFYSTVVAGNASLFKQRPDGQTIKLADSIGEYWAVSPDETLLAAEERDQNTGAYRIELRSLVDGAVIKSFAIKPARQLGFTPDGKNLTYDSIADEVGQIMLQPIDGREPYALTNFQTDRIFSFSWARDGNRLAVIRGKILNDAVLIRTSE